MIRRIQTLCSRRAVICIVVSRCNPVGRFIASDGFAVATLYNLWMSIDLNGNITHNVYPWCTLFGIQTLTATLLTFSIFMFNKRALQMRMVSFCMIMLACYYIIAIALIMITNNEQGFDLFTSFKPSVWAGLPLVGIILCFLAFRGIIKYHVLVTSYDRLR